MYVGAGGDGLAGQADDLTVLEHGFAGGDGAAGNLVPGGDIVLGLQAKALDTAAASQGAACDGHGILIAEDNHGRAIGDELHGAFSLLL